MRTSTEGIHAVFIFVFLIVGLATPLTALGQDSTKTVVFTMTDPRGDDKGPGTYHYPVDYRYINGSLDIVEFEVSQNDSTIIFNVTFADLGGNPFNLSNGFSIQEIQIYVHVADGYEGRTDTLGLNLNIRAIDSWQFMLILTGEGSIPFIWGDGPVPPSLIFFNGTIITGSTITVYASGNSVIATIPKNVLGEWTNNISSWRYFVAVTPYDRNAYLGIMNYTSSVSSHSVGGADPVAVEKGVQPKVVDILTPNVTIQSSMLMTYDAKVGHYATVAALPYAAGSDLPAVKPPITITRTVTTTETLTKYVHDTLTVTTTSVREYYGVMTWSLLGLLMLLLVALAALLSKRSK